jgi:predicted flap endonuclease-1-like 5' DNA nuclease
LTLLDGVGPKTAYALQQAGIGDVADLAEASPLQVAFAAQVSEKRARIWIAGAKDLLT